MSFRDVTVCAVRACAAYSGYVAPMHRPTAPMRLPRIELPVHEQTWSGSGVQWLAKVRGNVYAMIGSGTAVQFQAVEE